MSTEPKGEYPCGKCDRVFTRLQSRGLHMRAHRRENDATARDAGGVSSDGAGVQAAARSV